MAILVDAGRAGDVWRVRSGDRPVLVDRRKGRLIGFRPVGAGDGRSFGIGRADWGHTLLRLREDVESLTAGDIGHIYVPETDIYILEIAANKYKASGKGWTAWRTGQPPTEEFEDFGLFFGPSSDWDLDGELLYRPLAMLEAGEQLVDADGVVWVFEPAFKFVDGDGQAGIPAWPLQVANGRSRTGAVNSTSVEGEKAAWAVRSGVGPELFDLKLPDW